MRPFLALPALVLAFALCAPHALHAETAPPPAGETSASPPTPAPTPPAAPKSKAARTDENDEAKAEQARQKAAQKKADDEAKAEAARQKQAESAAAAREKTARQYKLTPGRSIEIVERGERGEVTRRQLITKTSELRAHLATEAGANALASYVERDLVVEYDEDED